MLVLLGVDFTSAPRRAKPITVARGALDGATLVVECVDRIGNFADFEALLRTPGPWVGGFDFPFGLPRELVVALGWPTSWPEHDRRNRRSGPGGLGCCATGSGYGLPDTLDRLEGWIVSA